MLKPIRQFFKRFRSHQSSNEKMDTPLDSVTQRFVEYNQQKWLTSRAYTPTADSPVVLVGLFSWKPSIFCYSYVANYLANRFKGRIEAFSFAKVDPVIQKVYASFGAELKLGFKQSEPFLKEAQRASKRIFSKLKSKRDVLEITLGSINIGDLIYDTYLRRFVQPTADLKDPRLLQVIEEAVRIFYACQYYLDNHRVLAIIPDHTVYINCGILIRMASQQGIPIFLVAYKPQFILLQLDPHLSEGMPNLSKHWPYHRYKQLYNLLPPEVQSAGREKASPLIEERLSGKVDNSILTGVSAYGKQTDERVMEDSEQPKILILLHDFCDSVHCYRTSLFPDFYEWIHFLLQQAEQTPFEWYVKPHPNSLISEDKNKSNQAVLSQLKTSYPKIRFLEPDVSNRQLVQEGIRSVFTVHSTAGHEFAYMGVPVVNAGDNLHITFNFNLHPKTLEAYQQLIQEAGNLPLKIDPEEVKAFIYMHYFYFYEQSLAVNPINMDILDSQKLLEQVSDPAAYLHFIEHAPSINEAELNRYLESYFSDKLTAQPALVASSC